MDASSKRRRVLGALLVLVLAGVAWWGWSARRGVVVESEGVKAPAPFVRLTGAGKASADRVLQERAEFFDPTPLFLPTARNAGQAGLPAKLIAQPGQIFADFPAKWSVAEANLPGYGADVITVPDGLADVMSRANEAPFAGLGEIGRAGERIATRAAFVEVKSMQGSSLIAQAVVGAPVPRGDFAPLEFLATVGAAGLVGDPLLVSGSGAEDVDSFFRDYLAKTFRLGERLAPGVYRVVVGP
jgi:hypothetical protein